jgi:FMN phosphatase YigB (HAD superfamily)
MFVRKHQLTYDETHLQETMLVLQERGRQNPDTASLLMSLFEMMHWPANLQNQFLDDLRSSYRPTLFEDSLPFLQQLRINKHRVYVLSNNKRTPEHVHFLNLDEYIEGVFTPHICPNTQPKPHPSLWKFVLAQYPDIDPQETRVIGDDPWSDGVFAESCDLPCWILDRSNRFSYMYSDKRYHWVTSLLAIPM